MSDPAGGQFQARLNESVSENHTIFSGTRSVVLYMAQHHPRPAAGAAQLKPATWSPDTKVYAHNSENTMSKATKRFKLYRDSKKYHSRHGMCTNPSRAETFGPIKMSESFCTCDKCLQIKFTQCLLKQHVGTVRIVEVPRKKDVKVAVKQSVALPAFVIGVNKTRRGLCQQWRMNGQRKEGTILRALWIRCTRSLQSEYTRESGSRRISTSQRYAG
mgnify:CR=1 FL=1